ncbi:MAG: hypothetical protein HY343_05915, partial [Lentisphaerae bacterium]|nr:hypothetical protein [Lentisphaerota bacterium]
MNYRIEDLGEAGRGDAHLDWDRGVLARQPETGEEVVIHPTFQKGFLAIRPQTRSSLHVQPDWSVYAHTNRMAIQGPGGSVFNLGIRKNTPRQQPVMDLLEWDWKAPESRPVMEFTPSHFIISHMDSDGKDAVYLLTYKGDLLELHLPSKRVRTLLNPAGEFVCNRADGRIYFAADNAIHSVDPRTGERAPVTLHDGSPCPVERLRVDGRGRAVLPVTVGRRNGCALWLKLDNGRAEPIEASRVALTNTLVSNVDSAQATPAMNMQMPYVFEDGSYVSRFVGVEMTWVDAAGIPHTFAVDRKTFPLQPFAIEAGGDRLW